MKTNELELLFESDIWGSRLICSGGSGSGHPLHIEPECSTKLYAYTAVVVRGYSKRHNFAIVFDLPLNEPAVSDRMDISVSYVSSCLHLSTTSGCNSITTYTTAAALFTLTHIIYTMH